MATQFASRPPITVDQYEHFEGYPGLRDELILGEIVMSPQPKALHQQVTENVHLALRQALVGQPFVAKQSSNIKFRSANSMPAPDVFVVAAADWLRACEADEYLDAAPVLAVEVISASNRKVRVEQKIELYLAQGVQQVWTLYPKKRTLVLHESVDGLRRSAEFSDGTLPLPPPLQGVVEPASFFTLG